MKLLDLNLLLYAIDTSSAHHEPARSWIEQSFSGAETIALSWQVLVGFVRLSTKAAVFANPLSSDDALDIIDEWLTHPITVVVHPTERHATLLRDLLRDVGTGGNLTSDAHLAALAIEHGAVLCTTDNDFGRFPGVRWTNPL